MGADGYGKDAMAVRHARQGSARSRSTCLSSSRSTPSAWQQRLDRIGESARLDDRSRSSDRPRAAARTRTASTSARPSSAAATSGSRGTEASSRSAAATTRSTTAVPGKPASTPPASRLRGGAARTLFDDADEQRPACPDLVPADGSLPRVRRRGARRRRAPLRRRPRPRRSCADRSGSPARRSCATPRRTVEFAILRRRLRIVVPEPEPRTTPIDPAVHVVDGIVHYGDRRRSSRASRACTASRSTSARRPSHSSSSTCYDGRVVEVVALENPQRFGGSDVMNRISYDEGQRGASSARRCARRSTVSCASSTSAAASTGARSTRSSIVGNATMRDIFFDLDVSPIGQRPYKSTTELELLDGRRTTTAITALAHELGLHVAPAGARLGRAARRQPRRRRRRRRSRRHRLRRTRTAYRCSSTSARTPRSSVAGRGRILAASCPAGPAFEGGEVTYGMQAADGAIESLAFDDHGAHHLRHDRRGASRIGLCGSGLIDLVAELRRTDRMSAEGRLRGSRTARRGRARARESASRAPMRPRSPRPRPRTRSGSAILLRELGVDPREVDRLYLAGGFAAHVDVAQRDRDRLSRARAGGSGREGRATPRCAGPASCSSRRRRALPLERLARSIEHVELETTPDFFDLFVDGCQFKPLEDGSCSRRAGARG